jgi:yeast amino acid transporter
MVAVTAGEAKKPWKDVPAVMSFVYLLPLALYPFLLLSAGANVNYADQELAKVWSRGNDGLALSPFVIAAKWSSLQGLPQALNAFFVISAYTAG